jgi:hypothetical protein
MPKKPGRDKRSPRRGAGATRRQAQTAPQSAAALLARKDALLPQLTQQVALQKAWRDWLEPRLPAPLTGQLAGVVERDGCLTVLAASAAWAARLRYAVAEMEGEIRSHAPALREIRVRVMPPR